jgi:Holliday junction resolvase RusA-like endonuclease
VHDVHGDDGARGVSVSDDDSAAIYRMHMARPAPGAARWYWVIASEAPELLFSFDVVPIAKERPRTYHGRRGVRTVTPERTKTAEEHLAWRFRLAMQGRQPFAGNLGMVCVFYRPDRRRIDGDNMLKLVCDAGNLARAWGDDSQITTKLARVELDKARPRTEIAIGPMASTLTR